MEDGAVMMRVRAREGMLPVLGLLAFAACSSGTAGSRNQDAGPDVATGGDAAGGSGGDAGGEGPAAGSVAEQACRDAIAAQCQRRQFCTGASSSAGCGDVPYPCPSYYFGPDSRRTVENVQACLPALQQIACSDLLMGVLPDCLLGGNKQGGEPCAFASQCASSVCSGGVNACGMCAAVLEVGQPCGGAQSACRTGTFCHRTTGVCTAATTIVHAAEGSPCDLAANPVVSCQGDLICSVTTSALTAGTCVRPPAAGQPCAIFPGGNQICAPGLRCGISTVSGSRMLVCGQGPCGTVQCPPTAFCYEDPMTPLNCRTLATLGQTCTQNMPGGDALCDPTTVCKIVSDAGAGAPASGTCVVRPPPTAVGDACDPATGCDFPLLCTGGHCVGLDPASCTAPPDAAAGG
jgi:hypothetical protein